VRDTAADEVIIVTDTYEHADRLQSYQRVAGVAEMLEVKPTVAAGSSRPGRTSLDSGRQAIKASRLIRAGPLKTCRFSAMILIMQEMEMNPTHRENTSASTVGRCIAQ
jgi:hypothetical protein